MNNMLGGTPVTNDLFDLFIYAESMNLGLNTVVQNYKHCTNAPVVDLEEVLGEALEKGLAYRKGEQPPYYYDWYEKVYE